MSASPYLIGIDLGTSGAKTSIIDRAGRLLAWSAAEYPIHTPRPGWAEEDPADWLGAVVACLRQMLEQAAAVDSEFNPRDIAGIGLSGQMHSLVCVDAHGNSLRPAIIWADQRSAEQVQRITAEVGQANLAAWTGNPLATGFMLPSWVWLKTYEPRTAAQTRYLLLPKDYLRARLTGRTGTEPSDAASTGLFDPDTQQWSAPMIRVAGLEPEQLPPVFPSSSVAGGLLPEIASQCGLLPGTPVVYGGSDVSLQALALGVIAPGTVSCTVGTGGQLFTPLSAPTHDPELRLHLYCHALPGVWHQQAAILTAGLALRWLRDQLAPGKSYGELADQAAQVEAALDGLYFLPFLTGERTPYMDPTLQAGFLGLGLRHRPPHLTRAVMEGVIFALKQGLDLMRSLGTPIERLIATGGATRHSLWLQLMADIFALPVYISQSADTHESLGANTNESFGATASARGAALLAGIGTGVYADASEAIRETVREPVIGAAPNLARVDQYSAAFNDYTKIANLVVGYYHGKKQTQMPQGKASG